MYDRKTLSPDLEVIANPPSDPVGFVWQVGL